MKSLLSRLAFVQIGVVVLAVVAAGVGVRQLAYLVIIHGDMMTTDKLPGFLRQTGYWLAGTTVVTSVAAGVLAWLLARQIIRPLLRIQEVAAAVAAGDYSRRLGESARDELGRLARAIDQMTESLSRVEQLRRDLVQNVAHELRTPLTSAQGLLCAMRDGLLPADERNLEQVAEEVARLTRLVEAIHSLSVSDAVPRGGLVRAPLDLSRTVGEVLAGMMPLFEARALAVTADLPPAGPVVLANRDALVQVLVNLLDNAGKYAPEGEWVRVVVDGSGTVAIGNGGPGIQPADLPHIFERFYRADKSRSRETGGAGIGLAIVQNLVDAQEGRVWAESRPGETWLRVRLPLPAAPGC
ncbi:MAG TPA: ATP-binding protein [Symbiobacteriaceae bacterium]|jgi:signal transduction histidine kinase